MWTDDALSVRERRLMTMGVLAALDKSNLLEIQFDAALERGALIVELNFTAERVIAKRAKAAAAGDAEA